MQAVDADEGEAVRADQLGHLLHVVTGGEELGAFRRVDAVEAGMGRRRGGDAHMHLRRPGGAHHFDDFAAGGAAHDAVIDQHNALAFQHRLVGRMLQLDAEMADRVRRLDEGAADIVVADDAKLERNATLGRKPHRRWHPGIRHRHDHIRRHRAFAGQLRADPLARVIHRHPLDDGIRPGKIDVFEHAEPRGIAGERLDGAHPAVIDHHDLAGLDIAHEFGADDVERAGLAG